MVAKKDWRSIFKRLKTCDDLDEHIELARGKEIKRPKDETRGVCFQYINMFTDQNPDKDMIRQQMQEEYQQESFWQRVGIKKKDREMPLYTLGKDRIKDNTMRLKKVFE